MGRDCANGREIQERERERYRERETEGERSGERERGKEIGSEIETERAGVGACACGKEHSILPASILLPVVPLRTTYMATEERQRTTLGISSKTPANPDDIQAITGEELHSPGPARFSWTSFSRWQYDYLFYRVSRSYV